MRILISGGGTGGHIYPALALIDALKAQHGEVEVLYIGTENGLESDLVPRAGIAFEAIRIAGLKRSLSPENIKTGILFVKAVRQLKKRMKAFRPDVVIGTGGFVSGPVVYTAQRLGIPTVLHEQNSIPGLTNKFLSKKADLVALSFQGSESQFPKANTKVVGNPRGSQVVQTKADYAKVREQYGLDERPIVLIYGGSRGAEAINRAVVDAMPEFAKQAYQLLYVTGQIHFDRVSAEVGEVPENVRVLPYVYDMPMLLACTDVVVSRAGASTIAEITALGIPSVLIPSPYVTADHQTKNAQALVEQQAAKLVREPDLNAESLVDAIEKVISRHEEMARASKALGFPHADRELAELVTSVSKK